MKNQMGGQHSEGCKCPMCQGKMCGMGGCGCFHHGGWHRIIRAILSLAIIIIVFCFGVMIGELKGALMRESSGYRMMRTSYYGGGYAYPMMGGTGGRSQTAPLAPTTNQ